MRKSEKQYSYDSTLETEEMRCADDIIRVCVISISLVRDRFGTGITKHSTALMGGCR